MNIVIMGAPGAGKGTHAEDISRKYSIPHISTGDILREEVQRGTSLGKLAKSLMDAGKLLPDDIIIEVIKNRLTREDCERGYLFDGFPRTLRQAEMLDEISNVESVIYLRCDDDVIIKRLTGRRMGKDGSIYNIYFDPPPKGLEVYQRDDDNIETIKERLSVFYSTFNPVMEFYKEKGIFYEVRGDEPREEVLKNIIKVLENKTL